MEYLCSKILKNEDLIPFVNDLIQDLGNESGRLDTVERKKDYRVHEILQGSSKSKSETNFT